MKRLSRALSSNANQWGYSNHSLYRLLYPLSLLYGSAVYLRNLLYDTNRLKRVKLPPPTIAVGNITLGGTGKTPFVIALCRYYIEKGYTPCVLSRGYRRTSKGELLVCDGSQILASPHEAGDEPYLIAVKTKAIVAVGKDRANTYRLVEHLKPDVVILDDAFQHRRVERDVNFCLIDGTRCFGNGLLFPAGPLREPLSSLKRASALVITKAESLKCMENVPKVLSKIPVFRFTPETEMTPVNTKGTPVQATLISAIANPYPLIEDVKRRGIALKKVLILPDHHHYTEKDFKNTTDEIITTEKDLVKFPESIKKSKSIWVVSIKEELPENIKSFLEAACPLRKKSFSTN